MTTEITRTKLREIKKDIDNALKAVADKHGILLQTGNSRFTDTTFTTKIEGAVRPSGNGSTATSPADLKLQTSWAAKKGFMGDLSDLKIGDPVKVNTMTGKFVGHDTGKRKYPFIVQVPSGRRYKLSGEQVRRNR